MKSNILNAIATSVIAFVTVIGFTVGFYYNLKSSKFGIFYILVFVLIFIVITLLFILWMRVNIENE